MDVTGKRSGWFRDVEYRGAQSGMLNSLPMTAITPPDRQQLLDVLTASGDRFRAATLTLTDTQWNHRPAPGKWSAADLAEHLALSEEVMPRLARKALSEPGPRRDEAQVREQDAEIVASMQDDAWHGSAVAALQPRRSFSTGAAAGAAFLERRARTVEYVRTTNDPLREHTFPHPAYGPLDSYQWLLMLAHHSDRHVRQIERSVRSAS